MTADAWARLVSQADQLTALIGRARDLPLEQLVPDEHGGHPLDAVRQRLADVDAALRDVRNDTWRQLRSRGMSAAAIAHLWKVSRQYVDREVKGAGHLELRRLAADRAIAARQAQPGHE